MRKGWYGQRHRHSLASRGIKSSWDTINEIFKVNTVTRHTTSYDDWLNEVEKILYKHVHLGIEDLPSYDWEFWYNGGFTPRHMVIQWMEEESELPEVIGSEKSLKIIDILETEDNKEYEKLQNIKEKRGYGELANRNSNYYGEIEYYFTDYPNYPMMGLEKLEPEKLNEWLKKTWIKIKEKDKIDRKNRIW